MAAFDPRNPTRASMLVVEWRKTKDARSLPQQGQTIESIYLSELRRDF